MKLELSVEEINFILQVLGELPTKSGAFPIAIKIKQQAEAKPDDLTFVSAPKE